MSHLSGAPGTVNGPDLPAGPARCSRAGGADHHTAQRSYLEAAAAPAALPYIRRHTRQIVAAWRLGHLADEIELVVSELITNAVTATLGLQAAAPVALYLALDRHGLYVLAWDCCPDLPVLRAHVGDAESGRGLELVSTLSGVWGACACAERGGKVTWARFEVRGQ